MEKSSAEEVTRRATGDASLARRDPSGGHSTCVEMCTNLRAPKMPPNILGDKRACVHAVRAISSERVHASRGFVLSQRVKAEYLAPWRLPLHFNKSISIQAV